MFNIFNYFINYIHKTLDERGLKFAFTLFLVIWLTVTSSHTYVLTNIVKKVDAIQSTVKTYMQIVGSKEYKEHQERLDRLLNFMNTRSEKIFFDLEKHIYDNKKKKNYDYDKIYSEAFEIFRKYSDKTRELLLEEGFTFEEIAKLDETSEFLIPKALEKYKNILKFYCETEGLNGTSDRIIKDNFESLAMWTKYNYNIVIKKID